MIVYLASPNTQQQAEHAAGMPVLLSYASWSAWLDRGYQQSFSRLLIDSGAYSEFSRGVKVDLAAYADWSRRWVGHADAIAGLDDVGGDWRRSLRNYEAFPLGFPTFHESDPPELLDDLVALARERGNWIGLGLLPPRENKERWVRAALERIPDGLHVHGWALRRYTHCRRLDSVDSTNWWREAMRLHSLSELSHLTYGECLEIVVKRYQRWTRRVVDAEAGLFAGMDG
ncbi:MAG TPA: hypothetical protein VFA26_05320 [Gemmataceae bacterium]|nr:hypothetical protein [Gemmataceae bacterium]